jgi:hypothetical protein
VKAADSIANSDRVNYLNIGLILLSCAVAFWVPFELFLFAYAILGPAHYLTEISWLHERKYFTKERFDFLFLLISCAVLFVIIYLMPDSPLSAHVSPLIMMILFWTGAIAAFCMVFLQSIRWRFIAFLVICCGALVSKSTVFLFSVFVPTLIHVFVFTALFMLYGAMKSKSSSGYLAFAVLLIAPLTFLFIHPQSAAPSAYVVNQYGMFEQLNVIVIQLVGFMSDARVGADPFGIYQSAAGVAIMRFIAFAYTYHYLNWFSKTSIIGWHSVSRSRLIIIGMLWLVSIALYLISFKIGFYVLLLLSLLHVFLEFPLNRRTLRGTVSQLVALVRSKA